MNATKEFSCYVDEAKTIKAFGFIQEMGPSYMSEDPVYVVDAILGECRYKFTILKKNKLWTVNVLSVMSMGGKLKSIDTFAVENKTVQGAFQDALRSLVDYKNHKVHQSYAVAVIAPPTSLQ